MYLVYRDDVFLVDVLMLSARFGVLMERLLCLGVQFLPD